LNNNLKSDLLNSYQYQPNQPFNPNQQPNQPYNPNQQPNQPYNPNQQPNQPYNPNQQPNQPYNPNQQPNQPYLPNIQNQPSNLFTGPQVFCTNLIGQNLAITRDNCESLFQSSTQWVSILKKMVIFFKLVRLVACHK
jgi:hypothetical protein